MPSLASGVTFAIFNSIGFGVVSNRIDGAFDENMEREVKRHSIADAFAFVVVAHSRRSVCSQPIVTVLFCNGGSSFDSCTSIVSMLVRTCKNGVYIRRPFTAYTLVAVHLNLLLSDTVLAFVISILPFSN